MKKILYFVVTIFLFSSCSLKKEDIQGIWSFNTELNTNNNLRFKSIEFKGDSLIIIDDNSIEYKFEIFIVEDKINFFDYSLSIELVNDSVLKLDDNFYVRESHSGFNKCNRIIVNLPFDYCLSQYMIPEMNVKNLTFGKRKDNGEYSLISNNIYIDYGEIFKWYQSEQETCQEVKQEYLLYVDKDSKMKNISIIIDELRRTDIFSLIFVFHSKVIRQNYGIPYHLRPYDEPEYMLKFGETITPPRYVIKNESNSKNKQQFITLDEKNLITIDSIPIEIDEFKLQVYNNLENDSSISYIFLYHKESSFENWINIINCIKSVYYKFWADKSRTLYGLDIENLDTAQLRKLRKTYRLKLVDYDIDFYHKLINKATNKR